MDDGVRAGLLHYAERQLPRLLTQMDRDPESPTFGCFDRDFWHYKIRDFPSAILQQGVLALDAARRGMLPLPREESIGPAQRLAAQPSPDGGAHTKERSGAEWTPAIERWCVAAVQSLARQVRRDGSVDEYYPFERSYPAAAFGLHAACRVLFDWQRTAPHLLSGVDLAALSRLAGHVARRVETQALNQQSAGLAGLALASRIAGIRLAPERLAGHADRLFASQHAEGWFEEYGGPDFGYLTVTLDALTDYHDATGDARAPAAIARAVAFLASLVGADGRLPSTLNSRNTDYVVPYGLARAGAEDPAAAWLVRTLFRDAGDPGHFLWATDDRYHAHYLYASCVRALEPLARLGPAAAPARRGSVWLGGCGYGVRWAANRSWTAYVAARKGGLVRIHRDGAPPVLDHGWRVRAGRALWTSNWWSAAGWAVERNEEGPDESITVRGPLQAAGFLVPRPWKHALLRLAARVLGERLMPALKRRMIFRPRGGGAAGDGAGAPVLERRIEIGPDGVRVRDRLALPAGAEAARGPRQNLRHVASADSFSAEELLVPTGGPVEREPDGAALSGWQWRPGE